MFKFRSGGQGAPSPTQPPTIEAMRRRARHRLIGASVLVLAGVIGFPLLFDSKPRPIPVDIPIDIPAKGSTKPLVLSKPDASAAAVDGLDAREEVVESSKPPSKTAVMAAAAGAAAVATVAAQAGKDAPSDKSAKAAVTAKPATEAKDANKAADPKVAEAKPAKSAEPAKAAKPTDTKPDAKAAKSDKPAPDKTADKPRDKTDKADKVDKSDKGDQRIVVQVGAFAESDRAHEVRQKLEHAGLKTYTHVAETPEGKRIRVRLGPYATRAEADKAAAKVKALGLPAAILTL